MTDEEKMSRLEAALQQPEGKYTHDQIRARLMQLRAARDAGVERSFGPGSKGSIDPDEGGPEIGTVNRGAGQETPGITRQRSATELEGDPSLQMMTAGAFGAAAAAPVAALTSTVAPSLAPMVTGAVSNGVAAHAQGADMAGSGRAAAIGALLGIPGTVGRLARQAPAATDARLQSSITPSRGVEGQKVAQALPGAKPVIDETPGLKKTLVTSQDPGEKALAARAATDPMVAANDADWDQIGQFYGGAIPLRTVHSELDALAASQRGNIKLTKAIQQLREDLPLAADPSGQGISPDALRRVRNGIAAHVESMNPAGNSADVAALNQGNARAIHGAINDAVTKAGRVAGVDMDAHAARSSRIRSMLPIQDVLDAKDRFSNLGPSGEDRMLAHPYVEAAKRAVRAAPRAAAQIDFRLAEPDAQKALGVLPQNGLTSVFGAVDPLVQRVRGRRKPQETSNAD